MLNSPEQAGLLSTYVFKIPAIGKIDLANLDINFPPEFFLPEQGITVAVANSNNGFLFDHLEYQNVERLYNNETVDGVNL